jgi:hypothetical protein
VARQTRQPLAIFIVVCARCAPRLVFELVRVLFDHRIGEDFARDALNFSTSGVGPQTVGERQLEVLALAHCGHVGIADLAQGIVDGLALRVQDRCLERDVDMCLHLWRL